MDKESVLVLARQLSNMKDAVARLDLALKTKNSAKIDSAKKEILELQVKIGKVLA